MTTLEAIVIFLAGVSAGIVNTVVGSGSLITFPTLVALGYPPLLANVSNTVGLTPGSISGAIGYRRELAGQHSEIARLGIAAVMGGLAGGSLLLAMPPSTFERVVPALILTACVLVALQPRLSAMMAARREKGAGLAAPLFASVFLTAVYGGYFGAAQGVILIAVLGVFLPRDLQALNGLKNLLTALVNGVAAGLFILTTHVAWGPAVLLACGSIVGGQIGAHVGRRLSPLALRGVVILVGVVVSTKLLVG